MSALTSHSMLDETRSIFAKAKTRKAISAASFLATTRKDMEDLGWDQCDVIIVTGDAYVNTAFYSLDGWTHTPLARLPVSSN